MRFIDLDICHKYMRKKDGTDVILMVVSMRILKGIDK